MERDIPAIDEILPHRGTMLLLDSVRAWDAESATAVAFVMPDAWYTDTEGAMPSWIGIELMAQTIAAHVGLSARARGECPKHGVLLGTRRYQATMPLFPSGATLDVIAKLAFRDDSGLGAYDCRISLDDQDVATATIKVFEPNDFATFLAQGPA